MPHEGNGHEQAAEEQAPETAPERTSRTPKLDSIADIVESDDLFFSMVSLTDKA
jgi:hypothetical protein